jgi:hypothetical protein
LAWRDKIWWSVERPHSDRLQMAHLFFIGAIGKRL